MPKKQRQQGEERKQKPKSRGNGEGSIYQRKDGRWCAAVTIGYGADGRLKRRVIYGKTRKEVQDEMVRLQNDQRQGKPIEPHKVTVREHFDAWMMEKKLKNRPGTWLRDESHYRNHILPALGHVLLRKLTYRQVSRFYLQLKESHLSPRTIHDIASVLRSGLRDAVRKGLIPVNPAEQVAKPTFPREEARFLDRDELQRFLDAAQGERLENLFILLANTGLRPGEALGLTWDDVDLDAGRLTVRRTLTENQGRFALGDVKTQAGRRTITLSQAAIQALRRQWERQLAERLEAGEQWQNRWNLVFTDTRGGPLRRSNIDRRDLRRIIQRAGLEGVTLHTFRHTHASMLIFQGIDAKEVSTRLGHANITITLQTYGHIMPGQDDRAAAAMDAIMESLGRP